MAFWLLIIGLFFIIATGFLYLYYGFEESLVAWILVLLWVSFLLGLFFSARIKTPLWQ